MSTEQPETEHTRCSEHRAAVQAIAQAALDTRTGAMASAWDEAHRQVCPSGMRESAGGACDLGLANPYRDARTPSASGGDDRG